MNVVDLVAIGIILLNGIIGAMRGFAWQVFRIGSIVLAIVVARSQAENVAEFMVRFIEWPKVQRVALAWVAIGILVYVVMSFFGHLARKAIEGLRMGSADRSLGFLIGAAKGAGICGLALQIVVSIGSFLPESFQDQLRGNTAKGVQGSKAFELHMTHVRPLAESWLVKAQEEWAKQTGGNAPGTPPQPAPK